MSLTKIINKSIEKTIVSFTQEISEKYGISHDELLEMWTNASKMKMKTTEKKKKKLSPWLTFCKNERVRIKKEDSSIPFGKISKMIGDLWKNMTDEDKKKYGQNIPVEDPVEDDDSKSVISKADSEVVNVNNWNEDKLKKMKISELRSLCDSVHLSKTGKKEVLIERLISCKKMSHNNDSEIDKSDNESDNDSVCDFNKDENDD